MPKRILPLKNHPSYYIHVDGFIFREINHKQRNVNKSVNYRNQKITYIIDGIEYDLLNLMIEYFEVKYTPTDKISFKIIEDRIPLSNINVKPFIRNNDFSNKENKLLNLYQCKQKAHNSNARDNNQITEIQVLTILKFSNFRCVYCGINLVDTKWELDHFIPLSRGGKNTFSNLVSACMICNRMKSNLMPLEFIRMVHKITKNNPIESLKKELPKNLQIVKRSKEINEILLKEREKE